MQTIALWILAQLLALAGALRFDSEQVDFNLNQNRTATDPTDYWGQWEGHTYHPSPSNWRFPFYTLLLDRFVNGDPRNDDSNGTVFEQDVNSNQLRNGGDLEGLVDSLDYLHGMGVRGIYIAGTPFLNFPWKSDGYSPLDLTLLDKHYGNIATWRKTIDAIHAKGMYVMMDNTLATLGDLLGFEGFFNTSTPFKSDEYKVSYKTSRKYHDFSLTDAYNPTCNFPRFWNESGGRVLKGSDPDFDQLKGCYESDFDQFGDAEAFGLVPDWKRELSKFASVQDRLREWKPAVRAKLERFNCMTIAMLDIDGFRYDKALQATPDALGAISEANRKCAASLGKTNFFQAGEITGGNTLGSIFLGRGKEPGMVIDNITESLLLKNTSSKNFIRDPGQSALDAAAFHYSIYRSLTRFLGLDGNLTAGFDVPINFVDTWNTMLTTNDFLNPSTGLFDPRHMYGVMNQDVFRWPAIKDGLKRMLLAMFITTLHMPGIPLMYWGEEQALYLLDNTASNYVFGRQPMASNTAWQDHGCYRLGTSIYNDWPVESALDGCNDDSVSLDHRDPTHFVRNYVKNMHFLRENYPVLNDGLLLQSLSNQTHEIILPGSDGTATETGMWSVLRDRNSLVQDLGGELGNQSVWLVFQNDNRTINYEFDCSSSKDAALIAPFDEDTVVKNLLAPYDEITLKSSGKKLGIDGSTKFNGCLDELKLEPYDFRAYVPRNKWLSPPPMLTGFLPGHDTRILSSAQDGQQDIIDIELHFSQEMDCNSITDNIVVSSTTEGTVKVASIDSRSVRCTNFTDSKTPKFPGAIISSWRWTAKLSVSQGIHVITVENATSVDGGSVTGTVDRLMLRVGRDENPMVFPRTANYSQSLIRNGNDLTINHKAAGADQWRYSTNWGSSWSEWQNYQGGTSKITLLPWSGTRKQKWKGDHAILQYWSKAAGSSNHIQHVDVNLARQPPRRFPHLFAHGPFNDFGFDDGLENDFAQDSNGTWKFHLMTEWPTKVQVNVWGMNPDKKRDSTFVFGDVDGDGILDRLPPDTLTQSLANISIPPAPYLAYQMELDDGTNRYRLVPVGHRLPQVILFALLWVIPAVSGAVSIWIYMRAFYGVKFNAIGFVKRRNFLSFFDKHKFEKLSDGDESVYDKASGLRQLFLGSNASTAVVATRGEKKRRTVLIATMEYDIEDWKIKIKIGGLGVMAQLMGKSLEHQDLIWVVPCVGGIDYPIDTLAPPMTVTILDKVYEIQVQYHKLKNITYVLLDAPIFRQQTKNEPYPPRMDDLASAVYYSAWNACIAAAIKRFPIDIYHINDYHGAAAPLYLLPETIPCCLSLHNAEFQGLWPMRNHTESDEVCKVYNLDKTIVEKYVQFGEVFNLLHAGASYLRVHQRGFGAVGVSKKYGARSYARYPIFWGLKEIGSLPNPDPSDTAPWNPEEENQPVVVDPSFEASRGDLRRQAQEWANLKVDPDAELFVFVGRWSLQKGVDLIADVFPSVLDKNSKVQLICVGPVIDMYGKFAALKLSAIMAKYPGRVFSKPEFTALPPFIFSGAEFALIPSRDEPFGLVAVEFGRKGALGVGARVGGLGQCPGWWYSLESASNKHLIEQFTSAIQDALASNTETRAMMRARSAKVRFPVAQWVRDLDILQSKSIEIHKEEAGSESRPVTRDRPPSPPMIEPPPDDMLGVNRTLSLGVRHGPGGGARLVENPHADSPVAGIYEEQYISYNPRMNSNPEVTISQHQADVSVARTGSLRGNRPYQRQTPLLVLPSQPEEEEERDSEDTLRGRGRGRVYQHLRRASDSRSRSPSPGVDSLLSRRARSQSPYNASESLLPEAAESRRLSASSQSIYMRRLSTVSQLSLSEVTSGEHNFKLEKYDPTFEDKTGEYTEAFESLLQKAGDLSGEEYFIADYLEKSEKAWFKKLRDARLGRRHNRSQSRISLLSAQSSRANSMDGSEDRVRLSEESEVDEFLLGKNYMRPSILKRWLQTRIGDWPIYSLLLGLGQIISVNSYQITLLTGNQGQTPEQLYIVGGVFMATTCLWWVLYRTLPSMYVLSAPWLLYGVSFALVGLAPFFDEAIRDRLQYAAAEVYAAASSSGSLFFALNFGDEGGAPIKAWVWRACIIQGTQQIWIAALFYWGSKLMQTRSETTKYLTILDSKTVLPAITFPIAGILVLIGVVLFTSLPPYYRQSPGKTTYFYRALLGRKIIGWFFVTIILQSYWLSTPYGRNWEYLWTSSYAPTWSIAILVLVFFIGIWAGFLAIFSKLSQTHSWVLPIFAIGLGAPRWCQMLWGTSSYGTWVPWVPGGPVAGAIAGRCLWLWLGVLDAIQGVGFGMILLNTLTRAHILATLITGQLIGTAVTMIAKATAPDKDGPGQVFPDFSAGVIPAISKPVFWIALGCQLVVPIGFFLIFRKAQLNKP